MPKKTTNDRLSELEFNQDKIIVPTLNKLVDYVESNKAGINLATLLNSKVLTWFLLALFAVIGYVIAKGGLQL